MAENGIPDDSLKCIIIGDGRVGKSSITKRLVENSFDENLQSTIGIDYEFATLNINNKDVKLSIWDTAGQEKFKSISRAYYRQSSCVLLVFDLTNKDSFNHISSWLNDVNSLCSNPSIILVGNKSDLNNDRTVSTEEAQSYAETNKIPYIETSAKDGTNITEAFIKCVSEYLQKAQPAQPNQNVHLQEAPKQSKGCC